jgi:hypothetical protein
VDSGLFCARLADGHRPWSNSKSVSDGKMGAEIERHTENYFDGNLLDGSHGE